MILNNTQFFGVLGLAGAGAYALYRNRNKFNPNSRDNIVYEGVNAVGGTLTGTDDFSLGGWIYDVTHEDSLL